MKPGWEQNKLRHNSLSLANALCYRMIFINHVGSYIDQGYPQSWIYNVRRAMSARSQYFGSRPSFNSVDARAMGSCGPKLVHLVGGPSCQLHSPTVPSLHVKLRKGDAAEDGLAAIVRVVPPTYCIRHEPLGDVCAIEVHLGQRSCPVHVRLVVDMRRMPSLARFGQCSARDSAFAHPCQRTRHVGVDPRCQFVCTRSFR
jgi:hypothetical protein